MIRYLLLLLILLSSTASAIDPDPPVIVVTGARDAEWAGYRHAYKAAAMFARMTATRPLIQAHMHIQPLREGLPLNGIKVYLQGEKTSMEFVADDIGRVEIPQLKQPYDEDAVLRLNRQKGHYRFGGRFTLREHDDGIYDVAQLRAACEQMLSAQREAGSLFRLMGKKCAGVKFIYAAGADTTLEVRPAAGAPAMLAGVTERAFDLPPMPGQYHVVTYQFGAWPATGKVIAAVRPLAIDVAYK